jgi:hypothetical protein
MHGVPCRGSSHRSNLVAGAIIGVESSEWAWDARLAGGVSLPREDLPGLFNSKWNDSACRHRPIFVSPTLSLTDLRIVIEDFSKIPADIQILTYGGHYWLRGHSMTIYCHQIVRLV